MVVMLFAFHTIPVNRQTFDVLFSSSQFPKCGHIIFHNFVKKKGRTVVLLSFKSQRSGL